MNIYQKINEIQKEVQTVYKGATVSMGGGKEYYAVSHDDVAALLHLPLASIGISMEVDMVDCVIEQFIIEKEYNGKIDKKFNYMARVKMAVTFVNSDDPKERFTVNSSAYAFDAGDKAVGKAQSMAVKYVYLKNFNLESTDQEESRSNEYNIKPVTDNKSAPISQKKSEVFDKHRVMLDLVRRQLTDLTMGQSLEEKSKTFKDICTSAGVYTFSTLDNKTENELKSISEKTTAIMKEISAKKQANAQATSTKPSFRLD